MVCCSTEYLQTNPFGKTTLQNCRRSCASKAFLKAILTVKRSGWVFFVQIWTSCSWSAATPSLLPFSDNTCLHKRLSSLCLSINLWIHASPILICICDSRSGTLIYIFSRNILSKENTCSWANFVCCRTLIMYNLNYRMLTPLLGGNGPSCLLTS